MPLIRFPTVKGLVYTIDLSKIAERENPRTVEAPIGSTTGFTGSYKVDWGDGTTETFTTETYPTHTYAAGAGDVFRVVVRVADGKLPVIRALRTNSASEASSPQYNITWGLVSLDHFGGDIYQDTLAGSALFRGCKNLTYIDPRYIGLYKLTTVSDIVRGCNSLSMPLGAFYFGFATQVTSFANCFYDCSGLTGSIPADLFKYNTSVMSFASCFQNCSGLNGSIPTDLFKYNVQATTFASCFYRCTSISGSIPADLFKYNIAVTAINQCFDGCSGLTGDIPATLFDNNINITNVNGAFRSCYGLTAPYEFWNASYAANITNTSYCYTSCTGMDRLQIPSAYGGTMTVS